MLYDHGFALGLYLRVTQRLGSGKKIRDLNGWSVLLAEKASLFIDESDLLSYIL